MPFSVGSVNSGITAKTGLGGLASGMDIDSLILKMTAASRKRITQQEQSVQKLMWRQDAYRSVTQSLMEFRSKYLDNMSSTNFKSIGLFSTVKATIADGITAFSASATADATSGKVYVNQIQQLATSYIRASNTKVSAPLTGDAPLMSTLNDLSTSYNGGVPGFMLNVDGQSRAMVFDTAFMNGLGSNLSTDLVNGSSTDISNAYEALETSMQRRINQLFENPANIDNNGDVTDPLVKVTIDRSSGAFNFSSDRASRISMSYLNDPTPKDLNRANFATDQDYRNALDQERIDSIKYNTLTKMGFKELDSSGNAVKLSSAPTNRLDITKSIDDLGKALGGTLQTPGPGGSYEFYINGQYFKINGGESVNSLISKINSSKAGVTLSYSEVTDKFTMTSNTTGAGVGIQIDQLNGTNLFTAIGLTAGASETFGTNSISYINGNYVERSTNDFIVDGVRFSLKELYNESATFATDPPPAAKSGSAVTLATNPDELFDAIKKFVDDYNAMVTHIRGLTKEKVYSDYEPLTDEQRAEMSEAQVKLWEEKAKSGILSNDNLLSNIASKLQSALLTTDIDGFNMFRMGIESAGWSENGKLKLDENKLKDALSNHADEIKNMFLKATDGISVKLDKVIDDAVRNNGVKGTRGSLIEMAGYAATRSDMDNALKLQIDSYNKRIDSFKDMLKKEESRLWSKFSAMETALSRLNEQSALLSQYLGTSTNSN